ncbi:hypothetical protein OEZ86_007524 [Tetradesmus obliquus]|uniref:Calponin-homology (CH) domain-containing protein n=1 Tax=Tetradesmus obliquus TaxID=3088 RepID=A0ABY8U6E2_TETOB|nr:hypothetical protein OEZ85_012732 [Tetradesmus obliquus]WIA36181.1 hypothetical protein OEZ86_007524 [Tetradesmus obliquus]
MQRDAKGPAALPALAAPAAAAAAAGDAVPGGAGFAGFGCGSSLLTVRPLVGPSWRSFKLPYSARDLSCLEQQLLRWMQSLDLISRADVAAGFASIMPSLASGVLLCEVAAAVAAVPVAGVTERPLTATARAANVALALEAVRHLPALALGPLVQQHEEALLLGERGAATALLEALCLWHSADSSSQQQQQQLPGWLKQHQAAQRVCS